MSTAISEDLTLPAIGGRHHFLFRRLHSLTGIWFGLYVILHLLVNATMIEGAVPRDIYQLQVTKIHELPFLKGIEWVFIYIPIIYHTIYGLWITFTGQPNAHRYPYTKNIFYFFQRLTALLLVILITFHVFAMKGVLGSTFLFHDVNATASTIHSVGTFWFVSYIVYPLLVICGCYHLANGFFTGAVTWGLAVSAAGQRRWGWICVLLFLFTLICGFLALIAVWMGR